MSYTYCLQFRVLMRQYIFSRHSLVAFVFTIPSIANTVWLFIQVRLHWTQHLPIVIQFLHVVPSFLLLVQALLQDWYVTLLAWYVFLQVQYAKRFYPALPCLYPTLPYPTLHLHPKKPTLPIYLPTYSTSSYIYVYIYSHLNGSCCLSMQLRNYALSSQCNAYVG